MKQIPGLRNMKSISREALIKALQGKYVAMVGLIPLPYGDGYSASDFDEIVAIRLRTLEKQIEEFREKHYEYKCAGLFKKTSQGYKRGNIYHYWQKGGLLFNLSGLLCSRNRPRNYTPNGPYSMGTQITKYGYPLGTH